MDSQGFETVGIAKVEQYGVSLKPLKNVKPTAVLEAIVGQIENADWVATFVVQDNYVEITPIHKHVKFKKPLTKDHLEGFWSDLAPQELAASRDGFRCVERVSWPDGGVGGPASPSDSAW